MARSNFHQLRDAAKTGQPTICVVGLGYVGRELAEAFAGHFKVIGFDVNRQRLKALANRGNIVLSDDPEQMRTADFILITVPTPLTPSKEPDLSHIIGAAEDISRNLKPASTIILESTVYPGVTEEVVKPILEKSGLKCGRDFGLGYSPERINTGDKEHTIAKVTKVVSGTDDKTTELIAQLYLTICPDVFRARNIKTAEAAKVIENVQRDLNIALVNELSIVFDRLGLDTSEVLEAAATKWNFYRLIPGFVGGHCIPVDPFYLVHKARQLGYEPRVILAGRAMNDYMPKHVAWMAIKGLISQAKAVKGARILVMGLAYKGNVADSRETKTRNLISELKSIGAELLAYDPLLKDIEPEFGVKAVDDLRKLKNIDCLIFTVGHDAFVRLTLSNLATISTPHAVLIDIPRLFDKNEAQKMGFDYRSL